MASVFLLRKSINSQDLGEMSMAARHEQWMAQHGRVYKDAAEKARRFQIFKANYELIERFIAQKHKFKLEANKFADLTNDEFRVRNGFKPSRLCVTGGWFKYENVTVVPTSMNWRAKGAVTPVKDQDECCCCWAFSAVASTEGINKLTTGKLISLSEQELVDYNVRGEDQGCSSRLMDDAFKFIIKNKGLTTKSNYPYQGTAGTCNAKIAASSIASITGNEDVPANSKAALLKAVANQPVSIAINAGSFAFQLYSSSVFMGYCRTDLVHGVTAVGYRTASDRTKYWLVKNSWESSWRREWIHTDGERYGC